MERTDHLIVGQGLAGTLLAFALIRRGRSVLVVDDGHRSAASMVAAGLINPLAGIRFNHAPQTHAWLSAAETCYPRLEHALGVRFWHPLPMLRLFRSPEQVRFFERRLRGGHDPYTAGRLWPEAIPTPIAAPFGGFRQTHTGFVDLPILLAAARAALIARGQFRQMALAPAALAWDAQGARLGDITARQVIICTGARLGEWPGLDDLPLQPEHGEILDLESPEPVCHEIINAGYWLVPHSRTHYRFGATHQNQFDSPGPSQRGRKELLAGLAHLLGGAHSLSVTRHTAGIRPATPDRAPLVGPTGGAAPLYLFNGFGGRGCLKAPWYAEQLAAHLVEAAPLPAEAQVMRFAR